MLKKLLKYDLKSVLKVVVIFYCLALFFSILTRFLSIFDSTILNMIGKVTFGIAISMLVSSLINTLMRCWVRFKTNLYGDESYLTHTLPVSKQNIYLSKVLTAVISSFLTILVILLALFIMLYSKENMELLRTGLNGIAIAYNSTAFKLLAITSIIFFLEVLLVILIGNFGIIVGHKQNNNKMVMSIIFGFIAYMATQTFMFIILLVIGLFNRGIMDLFISNNMDINTFKLVLYIMNFIYLLSCIIYYILGSKLLKKGVNID